MRKPDLGDKVMVTLPNSNKELPAEVLYLLSAQFAYRLEDGNQNLMLYNSTEWRLAGEL